VRLLKIMRLMWGRWIFNCMCRVGSHLVLDFSQKIRLKINILILRTLNFDMF